MNRGVTTRSRAKRDIQEGKNTPEMDDTQCANDNPVENMCSVLQSISKEIRDFRTEHKVDLHTLKEELKEDMKMNSKISNRKFTKNFLLTPLVSRLMKPGLTK